MYSDRYNPVCVSEAKGLTNYTLNVVDDIENNIANVKKIMSNCGVSGEGITASLSKIENSIERIRNIPDFIEKSEMAIFKQLIKSSQWSVNLTQWLNSGDISSNELVNMASMYLNAFIEIYGNDYYKQLKEINQPLSALIEKGLPSNVANNLNQMARTYNKYQGYMIEDKFTPLLHQIQDLVLSLEQVYLLPQKKMLVGGNKLWL